MRVRLVRVPYDAVPVLLSGTCGSAIGALAAGTGIAWFQFAPPDGLTPREVQDAVRAIAAAHTICSASLAAYDAAVDPEGRALEAGLQLVELFAVLSG